MRCLKRGFFLLMTYKRSWSHNDAVYAALLMAGFTFIVLFALHDPGIRGSLSFIAVSDSSFRQVGRHFHLDFIPAGS